MITLHGVFGSPFVRAVRIALVEKGVPWQWAPFPLGAHKQEPYLSMHPFGKIPAMEDDGFVLYETNAMLRHIDRKAASPALIPADPYQAARMDQLMCVMDNYVWPDCRAIPFNRLIAPRIGVPVNEQAVADAVEPARTVLGAIAKLQNGADFLAGPTLSLADIGLVPMIHMLSLTPEGGPLVAAHPDLAAWLARMLARPSVQQSGVPPEKLAAA